MTEPSSPATSAAAPEQGLSKTKIGDGGAGAAGLPGILLVDDQPARLLTYEAILSGLRASYVRALSGVDVLRRLMERDFALILLDVSMPGMDGFETARMIREHPRFERTPIIFMTGVHVSELDRLKGYGVGAARRELEQLSLEREELLEAERAARSEAESAALISDLGLPGRDGYQLIREIRTGLRLTAAELPALALTAFARDEDRARALGHGYQAYLTKPYAVSQLMANLRGLVRP